MNLNLWVTCRHPPADVSAVYGARSALLLFARAYRGVGSVCLLPSHTAVSRFVHAYMESSGIEYVKPLAPLQMRESGSGQQLFEPQPLSTRNSGGGRTPLQEGRYNAEHSASWWSRAPDAA